MCEKALHGKSNHLELVLRVREIKATHRGGPSKLSKLDSAIVFFPNQAALEGFLQVGLRNRKGKLGGTGSPVLHFGGSPNEF